MRRIGIKYLICIIALMLGEFLLEEITIDDYLAVLIFGIILLLINMTLKPIMLLLAIPINMITFGLFTLVVNSFTVQIADAMMGSIDIDGFLPGLLVGAIVVILNFTVAPKYDKHIEKLKNA